jgi:hypothetical protein
VSQLTRFRLGLLAGLVATMVTCATARADVFGPITLASSGHLTGSSYVQQAELANDAVLSGDGRYVAFDGVFGGKRGVFRRDLGTGEIATVAEGDGVLPSISADGRYVSFTTTARLDEQNDTNEAPDVYVRDMSIASAAPCGPNWEQEGEQCPFAIASAVDGSRQGLAYEYPAALYASEPAFNKTHFGAFAAGRSALSADGSEVAFITTAVSDLYGSEVPPLPRMQVLVRHVDTRRTELISTTYRNGGQTSEPVSGETGAVFVGSASEPLPFPSPFGGASISADGSTVAWMGGAIAEQAAFLPGEGFGEGYTEPLWRRVGEPGAPTRRITGGSDPLAPQCQASGERALPQPPTLADPCQGPFETTGGLFGALPGLWTGGTQWNFVPQLSADGVTVAFLATARFIASGEELRSAENSDDLYVADMARGLTRVQATRRITELAGGGFNDPARTAPIVDVSVSPDGAQIAFASARTIFPLGSPALVSPPAPTAELTELYDADLDSETLTRVTQGFEGQRTEVPEGKDSTGSASFSTDGSELAFSSLDDNLVYGDGNRAADAFVAPRITFSVVQTPQQISSAPPEPATRPTWKLAATAASRRDGSVLVYVQVPGAGSLAAVARGTVRVSAGGSRARSRHAGYARRSRGTKLRTASVASRSGRPGAAGLVVLPLKLGSSYRRLAEGAAGLYASVTVKFSSPGHPLLQANVQVTFRRAVAETAKPRHPQRKAKR